MQRVMGEMGDIHTSLLAQLFPSPNYSISEEQNQTNDAPDDAHDPFPESEGVRPGFADRENPYFMCMNVELAVMLFARTIKRARHTNTITEVFIVTKVLDLLDHLGGHPNTKTNLITEDVHPSATSPRTKGIPYRLALNHDDGPVAIRFEFDDLCRGEYLGG